jgi:DNA-binding NarL/FixJ family response regulator
MTKGTLVLSREVNLHSDLKAGLEALGYREVTVSTADREALNRLINELKPRLVLVSCDYYGCSTPFMIGRLLKLFPDLKIAAVSIGSYPNRLAVRLIDNGVKSCVCLADGVKQFVDGLKCIRDGGEFVSYSVQETIMALDDLPDKSGELTGRETEVVRLTCKGKTDAEIAKTLQISINTVYNHKTRAKRKLDVRNGEELVGVAQHLGIIDLDELYYPGGDWPEKKTTVRRDV